jgi:hypothetical protein
MTTPVHVMMFALGCGGGDHSDFYAAGALTHTPSEAAKDIRPCPLALCHENAYPAPDGSGTVRAMQPNHATLDIDEVFFLSAMVLV